MIGAVELPIELSLGQRMKRDTVAVNFFGDEKHKSNANKIGNRQSAIVNLHDINCIGKNDMINVDVSSI